MPADLNVWRLHFSEVRGDPALVEKPRPISEGGRGFSASEVCYAAVIKEAVTICEHCEWETAVDVDALVEKYEDALSCAESWEEKNIYQEVLDDLKGLKRVSAN